MIWRRTYLLLTVVFLLAVMLLIISLTVRPRAYAYAERPWGQGYETQVGYMEPDHGYLYYWMMYHVLWSNPQPTYHIYVPPVGYARTYRPWYPPPNPTIYQPATYSTPQPLPPSSFKTGGSFEEQRKQPSQQPGGFKSGGTFTPPQSQPSGFKSGGGFRASHPNDRGGFKTGGDFHPPPPRQSDFKSGGSFSAPSRPSPPPTSLPSSSGGFKSGGGFGGSKKK